MPKVRPVAAVSNSERLSSPQRREVQASFGLHGQEFGHNWATVKSMTKWAPWQIFIPAMIISPTKLPTNISEMLELKYQILRVVWSHRTRGQHGPSDAIREICIKSFCAFPEELSGRLPLGRACLSPAIFR